MAATEKYMILTHSYSDNNNNNNKFPNPLSKNM